MLCLYRGVTNIAPSTWAPSFWFILFVHYDQPVDGGFSFCVLPLEQLNKLTSAPKKKDLALNLKSIHSSKSLTLRKNSISFSFHLPTCSHPTASNTEAFSPLASQTDAKVNLWRHYLTSWERQIVLDTFEIMNNDRCVRTTFISTIINALFQLGKHHCLVEFRCKDNWVRVRRKKKSGLG